MQSGIQNDFAVAGNALGLIHIPYEAGRQLGIVIAFVL